jgi:peptide/nickel transport system substrate-binding protein
MIRGVRRLLLVLAAIAAAVGAPAALAQTVLRTMITTDIRGLMPGISPDDNTGTVLQQVYEGLVAWRRDGTVAPMLAKDIKVSDDGLTYTFDLRDGVVFHNGAKLTAREVVWTWKTFLDPAAKWPCRVNFDGTRAIKIQAVEAAGDLSVRFRLAAPAPAFLSTMARADCDAAGIAHPDSVDAGGNWVRAIGTGPFKIADWRRGEYIELARHDQYSARSEPADGYAGTKAAKLDRIRFLIIPDPAAAKTALLAGNIDLWPTIDPKYAKELAGDARLRITAAPTSSINAVVMQTKDPLLADKRMRQAINAAIDPVALTDAATDGYGKPNTSPVPLSSRYFGDVQRKGQQYDVAEAKKLLAEAGYHGQPIRIVTNSRFAVMQDIAILVQAMGQAAGINFSVETIEFGTQLSRYFKGDYQLMVFNYTPYLDPMFVFDRFVGDKQKQADRVWSNPKAIELVSRLAATPPDARQPIYDELHRLFIDDSPMIVWSSGTYVSAYSAKVHGYEPWAGRKPRLWTVEIAP